MKISQKLENACRVLVQLAHHYDGESVTRLEALAKAEEVSASFLVQILNELKRAGLLESRRGKSGGYLLARDPGDITLKEIVDVIEPNLTTEGVKSDGESGSYVQTTWEDISKVFIEKLSSITLASMADKDEPMYFI